MKRSELMGSTTPLQGAGLTSPLLHLPVAEKVKDNGKHSLYLKKQKGTTVPSWANCGKEQKHFR